MKRSLLIGVFCVLTAANLWATQPPFQTGDPAIDGNFVEIFNLLAKHNHQNNGTVELAEEAVVTTITGEIRMYGGSSAPTGWLFCDGSTVSRTTYADLFDVIGTSFGPGNGSDTFNLPNMADRFPAGKGSTFSVVGSSAGASTHNHTVTISTADLSHTHQSPVIYNTGTTALYTSVAFGSSGDASAVTPLGTAAAAVGAQANNQYAITGGMSANSTHSHGGATASTSNLPPYMTVNFIIKY